MSLLWRSSPLAKGVLLILLIFSATSWGIVLYKTWQLQRARRQTSSFLDIFRRSSKFSEVQAVCRNLADSPLVGIFQAGYAELTAQLKAAPAAVAVEGRPAPAAARPTLKSVDALDRALLRAAGTELSRLEKRLTFLATTASVAPYIGLFGTVWGIMMAFQGIATSGSTSLAVVAAPIGEALIATAVGLFAAIPAVYFYNHFTEQVKQFATAMDDFSMEFLTIAERNFT
ncbi:MAG: MotA/TolQ/ExbB proton channel family protein [Vicinamibacteraceae bacterium]